LICLPGSWGLSAFGGPPQADDLRCFAANGGGGEAKGSISSFALLAARFAARARQLRTSGLLWRVSVDRLTRLVVQAAEGGPVLSLGRKPQGSRRAHDKRAVGAQQASVGRKAALGFTMNSFAVQGRRRVRETERVLRSFRALLMRPAFSWGLRPRLKTSAATQRTTDGAGPVAAPSVALLRLDVPRRPRRRPHGIWRPRG